MKMKPKTKMKNSMLLILIFIPGTLALWWAGLIFILLSLRCDTTEPPLPKASLTLTLEDVSCTEAWITLKLSEIPLPVTVTLYKNSVAQNIILCYGDTLLYIDSLLPKQTYLYQASGIRHQASGIPHSGGVNQASAILSNELSVTTMDTTSHNFTFQTWTFGEHSSSALYDVAIINENNIWAVGEIYMKDSLGRPDPNAYNAVHWDGQKWELKRIYFPTVCGSTSLSSYPAKSIFAFDDGKIWISSSGDKIAILKDGIQIDKFCLPSNVSMSINKLWGKSSNDLYAVGNGGNIAHYSNGSWRKIESGTTTNINDVWGIVDSITQKEMVFCAVSFVFQSGDQKILTIKSNKVDSLSWNMVRRIHSIWSKNNLFIYTAGGGIFENKRGYWNEITEVPLYYSRNIRGTEINNIYVCGDFGLFSHYNGAGWRTYNELHMQGIFFSLSTKNNSFVIVGLEGSKAIIVKGTTN